MKNFIMEKLNLEKPLVIFDLETTGVMIEIDKILELAYIKIYPDGKREEKTYKINPEIKIPQESIDVHKITNEDVQNLPNFSFYAQELFGVFSDCYYGGFNIVGFDLPMLQKEFKQAGFSFLYKNENIIDSKVIFHTKEKRDLTAAYKFYCQKDHIDAHSAMGDIIASEEILKAQLNKYPDLSNKELLKELHTKKDDRYVDNERKFYWRDKEAHFNFGKHRGKSLKNVASFDPGFLNWMFNADFSDEIKDIIKNALSGKFPMKD